MTPTLTLTATGCTLTYPTGEVVECETLEQAEAFLDYVETRC